ncbi:MAG: CopD family protein [Caldimonas sp.]
MLYVSLKAIHLLAVVVWLGGMFFMLACLRPAAAEVLEPPARVRLLHAALRRFFDAVTAAAIVTLLSGAAMVALAWRGRASAGLAFNMPLDWYVMMVVFVIMLAVFAHVRLALFRRVGRAVAAQDWPQAAASLGAIRWEVTINLVLGIFIVVLVRLGAAV